jgi:Yip1 domain.
MEIWRDCWKVLVAPVEFAHQQTRSRDQWTLPVAIVVVTSLVQGIFYLTLQSHFTEPISAYLSRLEIDEDLLRSFDNFRVMGYLLNAAGGLVTIPFWLVSAGFMTACAVLFDGRENFRKVLILNGYAHLPLLLYGVIALSGMLFWPPHVEIQNNGSTNVSEAASIIQAYHDDLFNTPFMRINRVLSYAAQLWSLILLAVGASVAQRISYFQGAFAAAAYAFLLVGLSFGIGWFS